MNAALGFDLPAGVFPSVIAVRDEPIERPSGAAAEVQQRWRLVVLAGQPEGYVRLVIDAGPRPQE